MRFTKTFEEIVEQYGSRQALWLELLEYRDGQLFWKKPRAKWQSPGDPCGYYNQRYWQFKISNKSIFVHRVVYEMHHGDTDSEIDHIDRDRNNNRIENLRPVSRLENVLNVGIRSDNKSGYKGVSWHKATKSWVAQVNVDGKRKVVGKGDTPEEAAQYYKKWMDENRPGVLIGDLVK